MTIKHSFTSLKLDGPDATVVRPSDWNADHPNVGELVGIYDIRAFGLTGTDITLSLRSARDAAAAAGGGWIYVPSGNWTVNLDTPEAGAFGIDCVVSMPPGVGVCGDGDSSTITASWAATATSGILFCWVPTTFGPQSTITSISPQGSLNITLADATLFSIGDLVDFEPTDDNGDSTRVFSHIAAKAGNVLTLTTSLPIDVHPANGTIFIEVALFSRGGGAKNLRLVGTDALGDHVFGILAFQTRNQAFENLILDGWKGTNNSGTSGALELYQGTQNYMNNITAYRSGSGGTGDISIWRNGGFQIDSINSSDASGFGPEILFCTDFQIGKIRAEGSIAQGRSVKFIDCRRFVVGQVAVQDSDGTGLGLQSCMEGHFGQCYLRGAPGGVSLSIGVNTLSNTTKDITFDTLDIAGFTDYSFYVADPANTYRVDHIKADNQVVNPGGVIINSYNGVSGTLSTIVTSLPSAATMGRGARAFVTDATATTFGSIVAGGAGNSVPVYSDGSNWRIG